MPFFPLGLTTGGPYQPLDGDLTAIAALSTTGYARRTGTNAWTLDAFVPASLGGTGFTSYASGDLLYGNGGGTLSKLSDPGLPGYVLSSVGSAPSWVQLSTLTATTITGTANQVLVNGTTGSGQTGAVTLTLPQSIGTASDVQFNSWRLGSSTLYGSPLGFTPNNQVNSTGAAGSSIMGVRWSTNAAGSRFILSKVKNGTIGTQGALQAGDENGELVFAGSDGTNIQAAVSILGLTTANAATGDMRSAIIFRQYGASPGDMGQFSYAKNFLVGTTSETGLTGAGNIKVSGALMTSSPSGSTARAWLLGDANAVSPTAPNRTVAIDVNGTVLYLHAKTTND